MPALARPALYLYLDESGNLDFAGSGTRHLVLCAFVTTKPVASQAELLRLKYALLEDGINIAYFHASEDRQAVRDRALRAISLIDGGRLYAIVADKQYKSSAQSPAAFYAQLSQQLLTAVFRQLDPQVAYRYVAIIFDQALPRKDQGAMERAVKPLLKSREGSSAIYFHRTMADLNAQVADYGAWASYVAHERQELRPLHVLGKQLTIINFGLNKK